MRHASIEDAEAVADLLNRCQQSDGRAALSEFKELRVPVANAVRSLVAEANDGSIAVLAVAAWHPVDLGEDEGYWAAEIAVDPAWRDESVFIEALRQLAEDLGAPPAFWAFDELQAEAASSFGLLEARVIVEMRRILPAAPAEWPSGHSIRSFEPGDEGLWLALNQQVFAHHPEAGAIDSADLALRMAQPWFDPAGLLLLETANGPAGYCWTKMHGPDIGEIYMIGLAPDHRGLGLAKPLTRSGLAHLSEQGATTAILYAEASNERAVTLYEDMGFEVGRRLALYERELS